MGQAKTCVTTWWTSYLHPELLYGELGTVLQLEGPPQKFPFFNIDFTNIMGYNNSSIVCHIVHKKIFSKKNHHNTLYVTRLRETLDYLQVLQWVILQAKDYLQVIKRVTSQASNILASIGIFTQFLSHLSIILYHSYLLIIL